MTRRQKVEITLSFVVVFVAYAAFMYIVGNRDSLHSVQTAQPCEVK